MNFMSALSSHGFRYSWLSALSLSELTQFLLGIHFRTSQLFNHTFNRLRQLVRSATEKLWKLLQSQEEGVDRSMIVPR
ncbi:hypothetical protein HBH56_095560 [Parastagonospora nodorum]|uniref:Uncharacterized protein n=1 Tax=Phaeosphaeria nodorum (strain SN15 / ATCC MYA-4574 / FGSC 10173) TaxID=321614 RepID=Q0U788_PHANO|nr:hypothetical protein SNOG_12376 [Parastagonospora nodorum SN15]KAH3913883.1 hypothetical protein HBH56_095560 [Parastagonospora nodorum]EAT80189.1 hypothetical protein SNOG_12376 [Parastagonospora nodorum SN15]KAH3930349.1 hypothetical protein HBH54_109880 [Parastagonospora nodorum]KAH3966973.1 hypothetical protein HBH51_140960 [Parastagonospora nodorum]KAH4050695.1 hypothetical protein HBH49_122010 [Parastagonospora nodorum]